MGKAYSYFASVETNVNDGKEKLDGLETMIAGLTSVDVTAPGVIFALDVGASGALGTSDIVKTSEIVGKMTIVINGGPGTPEQKAAAIANVTKLQAGLKSAGLEEFTLAEAVPALRILAANAEAQIALGEKQIKDANAASYSILFLYISMMITMGLAPVVIGVKKVACKGKE
jgi:hypothetical protein